MRFCTRLIAVALLIAFTGLAARAEVKTMVERAPDYRATFRFKTVPPPSSNDAAAKATFTIVAGAVDPHSGGLKKLNDGALPVEEDQPSENFFFKAGSRGGRLRADLGAAVRIRQVNTYSWHNGTRGAQVYRLYASDGAAADFNDSPATGVDPAKCGWKRVASVDTRPKDGEFDGQYGVSIADTAGVLGRYRYLLFDISCTATKDANGNTFYSEIDVIDEAGPVPVAIAAKPLAENQTDYDIAIDCTEMPELKDWVDKKLRPTLAQWYPKIVESLPSDGFVAPRRITVTFKRDMRGVAYTTGTRVFCAGDWFKKNLEGEAQGAVVHELVHVVQQIRGHKAPGWLIEGSADYIRWFKYEPRSLRPVPNPARAKFTDGYRTTAAFLNYLVEKHDKDIVAKLNTAMRERKYSDALFEEYTGKSLSDLWQEYVATLK